MEQYIPKSALVAELNKRLQERKSIKPSKEDDFGKGYLFGRDTEDKSILYFIDTLEVKGVDLDEETLHSELRKIYTSTYDSKDIKSAKHFFELGLQVAQKGE